MKIVQFPNSKDKVRFTKSEYEKFQNLLKKLAASISPVEAKFYIKEIDALVLIGKSRR